MNHIKKFNESSEEKNLLDKIFEPLGFKYDEKDSSVTTSNKFAKLLCDMAVRQKQC